MDYCHSLVVDKKVDLNSLSSVHSFLVNQSGISVRIQVASTDRCLLKCMVNLIGQCCDKCCLSPTERWCGEWEEFLC